MELRHLHYFIAVAEQLHFGKAAASLGISQPPLSRQISQLEEDLDVQLFIRTSRTVRLTPAGQHFLREARAILHSLDRAVEQTKKIHIGESGKIVVGYTGALSSTIIAVIHHFKEHHPDIELILQRMSSSAQNRALRDRSIQLGFLCPPIDLDSLDLTHVRSYPFTAAIPAGHPLAESTAPLGLHELRDEPFIMPVRNEEAGYFDTIISMCNRAGFSPDIRQEAEGVTTILSLVAAGVGISLVSRAAEENQRKEIVYRDIEDNGDVIDLYLAWNKLNTLPAVDHFIESTRAFLQTKPW